MTSCNPAIGDIWLAYVEFSDHPGVGKVRPVVVVDVQESTCTVIAAKATSRDLRADSSGKCIPVLDWQSCGLRKPSYIRIDQKFELDFSKLLRNEPLGKLPAAYLKAIEGILLL